MICPICQATNNEDAKFCLKCGANLGQAPASAAAAAVASRLSSVDIDQAKVRAAGIASDLMKRPVVRMVIIAALAVAIGLILTWIARWLIISALLSGIPAGELGMIAPMIKNTLTSMFPVTTLLGLFHIAGFSNELATSASVPMLGNISASMKLDAHLPLLGTLLIPATALFTGGFVMRKFSPATSPKDALMSALMIAGIYALILTLLSLLFAAKTTTQVPIPTGIIGDIQVPLTTSSQVIPLSMLFWAFTWGTIFTFFGILGRRARPRHLLAEMRGSNWFNWASLMYHSFLTQLIGVAVIVLLVIVALIIGASTGGVSPSLPSDIPVSLSVILSAIMLLVWIIPTVLALILMGVHGGTMVSSMGGIPFDQGGSAAVGLISGAGAGGFGFFGGTPPQMFLALLIPIIAILVGATLVARAHRPQTSQEALVLAARFAVAYSLAMVVLSLVVRFSINLSVSTNNQFVANAIPGGGSGIDLSGAFSLGSIFFIPLILATLVGALAIVNWQRRNGIKERVAHMEVFQPDPVIIEAPPMQLEPQPADNVERPTPLAGGLLAEIMQEEGISDIEHEPIIDEPDEQPVVVKNQEQEEQPSGNRCPNCSSAYPDGEVFCPGCGGLLPAD